MRGKKARELRKAVYGEDMSPRHRNYTAERHETSYWVVDGSGIPKEVDASYQPLPHETFFSKTPITVKADKVRQMYQFLKHPEKRGRTRRDMELDVAASKMTEDEIRSDAKLSGEDPEMALLRHQKARMFAPVYEEVLAHAG